MITSTSKTRVPTLKGVNVSLRAWAPDDVPFFTALRNDIPTQKALMAQPRPHSSDLALDWLTRRGNDANGRFFVIASHDSNAACGFAELREINKRHRWANLGICVALSARGRGLGREALALLEKYAKTKLELRKIVLHVLSSNGAAVHLYESAGYRAVGVHRAHHYCDGQYHDVTVMEKHLS